MSDKTRPEKSEDSNRSPRERPRFKPWEVESFHSRLNANRMMFSDAEPERRRGEAPADKSED